MKKFLDLSSWRTALGNLLPSAHGHQGGSRKAAIGSMLIMAFAFVGCDDSSSASVENSEPAALSSAEKQGSSSLEKLSETSSGSADKVVSSSSEAKKTVWNYLNPDIDYDEFTDKRDSQVYKTVQIGEQIWMAQNLNYETENSWCGGGIQGTKTEGDCPVYGRLYTWAAAIGKSEDECGYGHDCDLASAGSATFIQGVCPDGWHVPTRDEWKALIEAVDGSITVYMWPNTAGQKLKAQAGWAAYSDIANEDAYGFAALPAGIRDYYKGEFYAVDGNAYFWGSQYHSKDAYYVMLSFAENSAELRNNGRKDYGYSVRCVKD